MSRDREGRERRRLEALRGISGLEVPECACCREVRVWALTFDHIHGGGTKQRRVEGQTSTVVYVRREWRRTGEWPRDTYRVLCATCNQGARMSADGRCPHETEKEVKREMSKNEMRTMLGSLIRVFIGATLAQFIAGGGDVFNVSGEAVKAIIGSGIGAVAIVVYNWANPNDYRYGRTK